MYNNDNNMQLESALVVYNKRIKNDEKLSNEHCRVYILPVMCNYIIYLK